MERVSGIPELLDIIFGYSSTADNARCARASRAWSDIALDHVWWENPPLEALLSLLAPLFQAERPENRFDIEPTMVFARPIKCRDRRRFRSYAKRVISFKMTHDEMRRLHSRVYRQVVSTCPDTGSILPRLKVLHVEGHFLSISQIDLIIRFFHESITEVNIQLARPDVGRDLMKVYCYEFAKRSRFMLDAMLNRAPGIKRFVLWLGIPNDEIEDRLCLLLDGLRHLEMLHLYTNGSMTPVLHSAAMLPKLRDFLMLPTSTTDSEHVELQALDPDHAFRSLKRLVLRKDLSALSQLYSSKVFPSELRTLKIVMVGENRFSDFRQCFEVLAISFPKLVELQFLLRGHASWSSDLEQMAAYDLSPLTAFPLLECFGLHIDKPFNISDKGFVNIIKECSSLRKLRIRCAYLSDPPTSLTLGFLALLARKAVGTKLEHLDIHLDATTTVDLPAVEGHLKNLRTISFGISPVRASSEEMLSYLSQLIPSTCQFRVYSFYDGIDKRWTSHNEDDELLKRRTIWNEIGRSFGTFDDEAYEEDEG
ncbi:hypothetical protein M0805_002117 [Coniferiporia weirii]|nr:hypothetical protein M0805_002117 [Coniferiporia weirii]